MISTIIGAVLLVQHSASLPVWPRFGSYNTAVASVEGTVVTHFPWHYQVLGTIAKDGTLFSTYGNDLVAIAPNGEVKWSFELKKPTEESSGGMAGFYPPPQSEPALDKDGNVYDGSEDGYACCLTKDGELRWKVKTESTRCNPPAIGSDGTSYFLFEHVLYAVSVKGRLKWVLSSQGFESSSDLGGVSAPSIGSDGTICLSSASEVTAITKTGVIKWKTNFRDTHTHLTSSPTISNDGTVYLCCNSDEDLKDGGLVAIDSRGKVLWKFKQQYGSSYPPAIGKNGDIYFGSYDGLFYSIQKDGKENWHFNAGKDAQCTPAVSTDGSIYFLSATGLHALSPSGRLLWEHPFFVGQNTSPVLAPDGPLYLVLIGDELNSVGHSVGEGVQLYSFK